jgi:hypothetical protein
MNVNGYPTKKTQKMIREWDFKNMVSLISFIKERWAYANSGYFKVHFNKGANGVPNMCVDMHTAGWSGNEVLIDAFLKHPFSSIFYKKWETGGHHYFEISLYSLGFRSINDIAKDLGITRQGIHKTPHRYEWITVSKKKQFIRPLNIESNGNS